MAMNAKQSAALIALAREKKLFLMEGMWTRFFPSIRFVRKLLNDHEIGEVRHVHAEIGYPFPKDEARLWKNELGGGGLLDIGIYPLAFATMVFGTEPEKVTSTGTLNDGGVDVHNSVTLHYSDLRFATIEYSMLVQLSETVTISGTTGRIHIHTPAHLATEVSVIRSVGPGKEESKTTQFAWPDADNGYSGFLHEGEAVTKAIQTNQLEAEEYSLDESLGIMTIMDKIRKDIGLVSVLDVIPVLVALDTLVIMTSINTRPLRWGILGCGRISHTFASNVKPLETAIFHACAARSLDKAQEFATKHNIPHAYDSYEALCSDLEVDVVYIGTIHPTHCKLALLALNHGKHVLVEKPMAMNVKEAEAVIKLAQQKHLFFMEGMWARFFPAIRFVRQLIDQGGIGDVHHVHSAFGVPFKGDNDRIWKKELGGGGLLDIGIYVIASATMVLGFEPENVTSAGKLNDKVEYSTLTKLSETVTISGSKGRIFIQPPAHATMEISVVTYDEFGKETEKTLRFPWPNPNDHHSGFLYEAEAVTEAIHNNQIERSEYSHAESLGIMKIMDQIRHNLGLVYTADTP
ncbi:Trans-1,2-dihydrobenzene-1,2-diol dehydrogenase [Phytophthora palmivora]|uniref:D-xylose 1-dehydrogenase (NADP(+), D-xylono-1,5-lactone-forming) n=1 Tax=Phytophthora palmivora TaxID=4796 RepID=A0A2P4WYU8_9STRA|nr:Trans-1,2-dihydrobenzene-1,2-diol dehydrogenase [Phytophthora palmivora]